MKLLGVDFGLRRTGLAATDPGGGLAYPLATLSLERLGTRKALLEELARRAEAEGAELVVVGLPLLDDGSESLTTRQARNFARRLSRRLSCPCVLVNELLSSEEAMEDLRAAGLDRARAKAVLDQQAAVRILERYLADPSRALALEP